MPFQVVGAVLMVVLANVAWRKPVVVDVLEPVLVDARGKMVQQHMMLVV